MDERIVFFLLGLKTAFTLLLVYTMRSIHGKNNPEMLEQIGTKIV